MFIFLGSGCSTSKKSGMRITDVDLQRFNSAQSEQSAIDLLTQVKRTAGAVAWDSVAYIRWSHLGQRYYTWDRVRNRLRIDESIANRVVLLNLDSMTAGVWDAGRPIEDSVVTYNIAKSAAAKFYTERLMLLMPFYAMSRGHQVLHEGKGENYLGVVSEIVDVWLGPDSHAPDTRYRLYINSGSQMITECAFYRPADSETPVYSVPFSEYRNIGRLFLSSNRGKMGGLAPVSIFDTLPDSVFTSHLIPDWAKIQNPPKKGKK